MARRFAKVLEEEIKTAFFYPSDLVNTKTTIPLRVGEERLGIYPPLFTSPSGDSCIIAISNEQNVKTGYLLFVEETLFKMQLVLSASQRVKATVTAFASDCLTGLLVMRTAKIVK